MCCKSTWFCDPEQLFSFNGDRIKILFLCRILRFSMGEVKGKHNELCFGLCFQLLAPGLGGGGATIRPSKRVVRVIRRN